MKKEQFIQYLQDTLIPDLIESGKTATAADFLACVKFMEDPELESIDQGQLDYEINEHPVAL